MTAEYPAARQLLRLVGFEADATTLEPLWVLPPPADLSALRLLNTILAREMGAHTPRQPSSNPLPPPSLSTPSPPAPPHPDPPLATAPHPLSASIAFSVPSNLLGASNCSSAPSMTLTEVNVARMRQQKLSAKPELSVPRRLVVLRPGEGLAAAPPTPDLSDEFFELHEDDLRAISLASAGAQVSQPQIQTAAMRELAKLQTLKDYSHARVRVRLPGGLLLEASYHPQEPVSHVLELVASCLVDDLASLHPSAYLFTTPPRTELKPDSSLREAHLVPAATAVLAWRAPLPEGVAALPVEELLKEHAKELLAAASSAPPAHTADEKSFPTVLRASGSSASASASSASASAAAAGTRPGAAAAACSSGGDEGGEGGGGKSKPKWLRM